MSENLKVEKAVSALHCQGFNAMIRILSSLRKDTSGGSVAITRRLALQDSFGSLVVTASRRKLRKRLK